VSTHYSDAQNALKMATWVRDTVPKLKQALDNVSKKPIPVFCYRGMSGTSLAMVLQQGWFAQYNQCPGLMYVRKENEISHSYYTIEHFYPDLEYGEQEEFVLVFVDDFVASGKTRVRTMEACRKVMRQNWPKFRWRDDVWLEATQFGVLALTEEEVTTVKYDDGKAD
jgi:hypothetical protein